jgi:hypothetical protein
MSNSIFEAFLDGVTGAGLFGKLRWPGAPTELIDSRSVEEFLSAGEFDRSMVSLGYHCVDDAPADTACQIAAKFASPKIQITGPGQINVIGLEGAVGVLSEDGSTVTWYVDGQKVGRARFFRLVDHQRSADRQRRQNTGSSSIAAEQIHEHAGRG